MTKKPNHGFLSKAIAATIITLSLSLSAQAVLTPGAGFGIETYYAHPSASTIISFDRDANDTLYYMTGYAQQDVWKTTGGAPTSIFSSTSLFSGASVVSIGDNVYFNDSSFTAQFIRSYGPISSTPAVTQLSTTTNYALFGRGSQMFITGGPFGNDHIYYSNLGSGGELVNNPAIDIASVGGTGAGALLFDGVGDMYYAPGGETRIYKWLSSELASAIANPALNSLGLSGHVWADYSSNLGNPSGYGASSMALDADGDIVVAVTSYTASSFLMEFGTTGAGAYDGTAVTLLTDSDRLGEVRNFDGDILVASTNQIVRVVPEPGSALMLLAGCGILLARRQRKS